MAGHSKFKNIQFRKGAQDKKRAKQFSRLAREITAAARTGKPDPNANPRLRTAIQNARANNMPKDNIQRAIGKSRDQTSTQEEIRYEGFSPGGAGIIMETLTNNRNRTASQIRNILAKKGGQLAEKNAVSFMFQRMGEVFYPLNELSDEDALNAAIHADAEDHRITEDGHFFFSNPEKLTELADALAQKLNKHGAQRLAWRPQNAIPLSNADRDRLINILQELDECDDVQHIYANAERDDGTPNLMPPL